MPVYHVIGKHRYRIVLGSRRNRSGRVSVGRWKKPWQDWFSRTFMKGKHRRVCRVRNGKIMDERLWGMGYWMNRD